jgi:hypothetical protein
LRSPSSNHPCFTFDPLGMFGDAIQCCIAYAIQR